MLCVAFLMINKVNEKNKRKRKDKKNEKGNTKKLFAVFLSIGTHGLKRKQNKQTNSKIRKMNEQYTTVTSYNREQLPR